MYKIVIEKGFQKKVFCTISTLYCSVCFSVLLGTIRKNAVKGKKTMYLLLKKGKELIKH